MMSNSETPNHQDDLQHELDLDLYLRVIWRQRKTVIRSVVVTLSLALFYLFLATPQYYSDVSLKSNLGTSAGVGWEEVSELLATSNDGVATAIEVVTSRRVVGSVVDELHLDIIATPGYFPIIGAPISRLLDLVDDDPDDLRPSLPGLGKFAWGGESVVVEQFELPDLFEETAFSLIKGAGQTYQLLDEDENVLISGKLGQLSRGRITLPSDKQGEISILVAKLIGHPGTKFSVTKLPHILAVEELQDGLEAVEVTPESGVIDLSWESADAKLTAQTVNALARVYLEQNIQEKMARLDHMLEFIDNQLPTVHTSLVVAEEELNKYHQETGNVDVDVETGSLLEQLVDLEGQISSLELLEVDYQQTYTQEHPNRVALQSKIRQLNEEKDRVGKKISLLPESAIQALNVERKVQIAADVYSLLLQRQQEFGVAKAGLGGDFSIVDQASVPLEIDNPEYILIAAVAIFLGGFIGLVLALFRKRNIEVIDTSESVYQFGLPVMAIVPHSSSPGRFTLNIGRAKTRTGPKADSSVPSEVAIAGLRDLRTSLLYSSKMKECRIILISAPLAGSGVSFLSTNLMCQFADVGKSVVLVDANLRSGHLHELQSLPRSPGLADIILDCFGLAQALRHKEPRTGETSSAGSMAVISAGRLVNDPAQVLMSDAFVQAIDTLKQQFDMVIVAAPPIIANTDAMPIVKAIQSFNLLVVRAGCLVPEEVNWAISRCKHWGHSFDGLVFNDAAGRFS